MPTLFHQKNNIYITKLKAILKMNICYIRTDMLKVQDITGAREPLL